MQIINDFISAYFPTYSLYKVKRSDYENKFKNHTKGINVYFLVSGNNIIYIGQTINLRKRLVNHKFDKSFGRVYIINCPEWREATLVEHAAIAHIEPPLNYNSKKYTVEETFNYHVSYVPTATGIKGNKTYISLMKRRIRQLFKNKAA